jgi:hypothetical protein
LPRVEPSAGRTASDPALRGCVLMRRTVFGPSALATARPRRVPGVQLSGSARRRQSRPGERRNGPLGCAPAARHARRGGGVL